MPCKRCRHLRRACDFNLVPAPPNTRAPEFAESQKEQTDRLRYMTFILKHHFPDLALDVDSLRRTYDALSSLAPRSDRTEATIGSSAAPVNAQPSVSPGLEDENCTIDYVDGSTARMSSSNVPLSVAALTRCLVHRRLLR
jgi:hypothetical protein